AAVRLLVVAGPDHPDLALEPEQLARERKRRSPLARAGLGRQLADPRLSVLVCLRHRCVGLVRTGRRDPLVLVIDVRGSIELALEAPGAVKRRRAPQPVSVAYWLGDLD